MAATYRLLSRFLSVLCLAALAPIVLDGCASLPPDPPRPLQTAISDWADTTLGSLARTALHEQPAEMSGFALLRTPGAALDARLALIAAAERSLDLQYHEFKNDRSGGTIMLALVAAGQRGVRVRVLIDDLLTSGEDEVLLELAGQANVEVRLFNPFGPPRGSSWMRALGSLRDADRVARRMHNKLFVADNAVAITGSRNLADEYLLAPAAGSVIDIDLLAAGPVVRAQSRHFDDYWNSRVTYPVQALATGPAAPLRTIGRRALPEEAGREGAFVSSSLTQGRLELIPGLATAYADPPTKVLGRLADTAPGLDSAAGLDPAGDGVTDPGSNQGQSPPAPASATPNTAPPSAATTATATATVTANEGAPALPSVVLVSPRGPNTVVAALQETREQIFIATPYLIPGPAGIVALRQALGRQRQITVLTNSLAATDEPIVHRAYALYRNDLLKAGARIYELSPCPAVGCVSASGLAAPGRLQSRITIADRRRIHLGSLNLDGRSARANTESGLIIDSPGLAARLLEVLATDRREGVYQVRLTPDGRDLQWVTWYKGSEVVYSREPETSWYERTRLWLSSPFIPSDLL